MVVFILGKGLRLGHHVLCVVAFAFFLLHLNIKL